MDNVEYNNNIFSFKGKIGRVSYIIQNMIIHTIGFKYIYYPVIVESYRAYLLQPESAEILRMLSTFPIYASIFETLASTPPISTSDIVIKYLFFIPLRLIDIKRIRDIVDSPLSAMKTFFYVIFLSLPFVDLIATIFLSVIPPKKPTHDLNPLSAEKDLVEAKVENEMNMYKKLFEEGKISQAEYLKAVEEHNLKRGL